jgi:hypothetical protein
MAGGPDDDAGARVCALDREEDQVIADPARPKAPEPAPKLLPKLLGSDFQEGQGIEDRLLNGTRERSLILLRSLGEDELSQGRALASPRAGKSAGRS